MNFDQLYASRLAHPFSIPCKNNLTSNVIQASIDIVRASSLILKCIGLHWTFLKPVTTAYLHVPHLIYELESEILKSGRQLIVASGLIR
jgi:hypothetical protein